MSILKSRKIEYPLSLKKDELGYIINHVFMPPKLPQEHDPEPAKKDSALLKAIDQAARSFCEVVSTIDTSKNTKDTWITLQRMVSTMMHLHLHGSFSRAQLQTALNQMDVNGVLPVYVYAQNAGIIFRKTGDTEMTFESFQASLPVDVVVGTLGKVLVTFPSAPRILFGVDSTVIGPLANILSHMAMEEISVALPKTSKGGSSHHETRDVADPRFITEALAGILRGVSPSSSTPIQTTFVHKRLNDEVLWKQAYRPWRRSSIWLVARVALHTTLSEKHAGHGFDYKAFQVFFMAKVLILAADGSVAQFSSDLLHFMNSKLARRLYKLSQMTGARMDVATFQLATSTVHATAAKLELRWKEIQDQFESHKQWRKDECPTRNRSTDFTFSNSSYLSSVVRRNNATVTSSTDKPFDCGDLNRRLARLCGVRARLTPDVIPTITDTPELYASLYDFQYWIEVHLPDWRSSNSRSSDDCLLIHQAISGYRRVALSHYQNSPERLSLMHLCILELWIALDEVVVKWCPLLAEYSPEIPENALDPLLLSEHGHMKRLRDIQLYLRERHSRKRESLSLFKDVNNSSSFANRFFSLPLAAAPLLRLHSRIERDADIQRSRKLEELNNSNALYKARMEKASKMDCEYIVEYDSDDDEVQVHRKSKCAKCREISLAEKIKVTPFEEPLPSQLNHSRPIVFELECPRPFAVWRDATQDLLDTLYQRPKASNEDAYTAQKYDPIKIYFKDSYPGQRITLASTTKSISRSHYGKPRSVPATTHNVILSHAGRFALYDSRHENYVISGSEDVVREACTFKLTDYYRSLQSFINNTTHSPNSVIASLHTSPIEISPSEYMAFGHLRSGNRLQWRNIMRALRVESLSFSHYSAFALVIQAVWQAGPAGENGLDDGNVREAHQDLLNTDFGSQVLGELEGVISSLKGNWKQALHLGVVIVLALRVNSFSPNSQLVKRSLYVLSQCRILARGWLFDLTGSTQDAKDCVISTSRDQYQAIISILLRMTFTTERFGTGHEFPQREDAISYLYAGITASQAQLRQELPTELGLLTRLHQKICLQMEERFTDACARDSTILDEVIRLVWGSYSRGRSWERLPAPAQRWWTVVTGEDSNRRPVVVHFNLLDGSFLLNGRPSDTLPAEITSDSSFRLLFQNHLIKKVRPAARRGMTYEIEYLEQQIFLGIIQGKLVIQRLIKGETEEFIPSECLEHDLPTHLLHNHSHWYSTVSSTVEVRPQHRLWQTRDRRNWMIHLVTSGDTLRGTMQKSTPSGLLHLVSPRSILYKNIHQALCPLEPNPIGLMIASEPSKDQWFNVHLPRYDLHFTLNDHNELECQNAPGYIINDDRQGVGCLFGLQNILCLRQSIGSHRNYKVIIPQGEYETQVGQYGHPLVSIKSASLKGCFIYDVDTHVGRLVGTRSTESDILLVKLHAYTSSSLPDPLTRRTGTSEALSRLQSASSYTFSSITDDWKSSLEDLAKITPLRTFYPAHLRVMESVTWHPSLPASSQSINFRYIVEDIIAYARNTLVFHQKHELVEALPFIKGMDFLSLRANQRDWTYQSNFASTSLGDPKGVTYIRPPKQSWDREAVAFRITSLSRPETYQFPVTEDFLSQVIQWNRVEGDRDWTWDKIHEWIKVPAITSISEVWCSLYELCRKTPWPPTFEATATLALLGYCGVDFRLISTLFAVMRDPRFRQGDLACTRFKSLSLRDGREWDQQVISQIIQRSAQSFGQSEESRLPKRPQETNRMHEQRIQNLYNLELDKQVKEATQEARQNWPQLPARIILSNRRLLDATPYWIEHNLYPKLETWLRNRTFLLHVDSVQRVLSSFHGISASTSLYEPYIPTPIQQLDPLPKLLDPSALMREHPPPEVPTTHNILSSFGYQLTQYSIPQTLRDMLSRLKGSRSCAFHDQYNQNLEKSILSLSNVPEISMNKVPALDELITNANLLSKRKRDMLDQMIVALEPSDASFDILRYTRSLPAITPYTLLQLLSFGVRDLLPPPWINCITSFAAMILDAQRNERMLKHMCAGKLQQLAAEASIQSNWSHLQNTDWLLVQIDGNFSIRSNQMEVALDMMASEGAENKLLQLNMGEGKSSVIVPVVAASVANGDALCRVIVPRAQTGQQLHRLRLTVTDLCNRRIIKLPFSRNTSLDDKTAVSLLQFLEASRSKGAIWLAEPEQLLSLKLLGLDKAMRYRRNGGGDALIKAQLWLNENTRDILDESDDVLHTRQQVIYTVGKQKDLDASPRRWEVVQRMLGLLAGYLSQPPAHFEDLFYKADPPGISGFPLIRIFSEEGRELLKTFIHQSLQRNDWALPPGLSSLAQEFVTSRLPSADTVLKLYAYCSGEDEYVLQTLLILRGMIGCDILVHSLKDKRWRVNYGLDLSRTYLAIPFRAKDFPSPRSEFGHPDVTILLTCLSYYYQGLDDNMVQHCIKQLLKSSTPDLTYTSWIQSCWEDVPLNFRTIRGINMEDEEAIRTQLYCYLRYNKEVIDFYLNSTVFPKEAKEFPAKLCTSGWDIACKKAHITTGFSGTNDDRFLLPSTIYQHDRDAQLHTNAKVLSYLLLEENRIVYSLPSGAKSHDFLERVMEIPLPTRPKVILDVGAQILDKSNLQFAKDWLSLYEGHSSIKAAIYFDEGDTLMAVSTDGTTQTLMDSPYSERLDQCLVYLDDAHTRGTDLRLPDMRAVVTLGPKMTKDKLVQGCMRMRKLGDGHTLVFMATDEVLDSIANISNVPKEQVTSFEVLIWAIKETWTQLQSNLPAWVLQGYSFAKRQQAWEELALREQYSPQYLLDTFGENEARPLKELYRVKSKSRAGRSLLSGLRSSDNDITSSIKERCKNFETFSIHEASVHEEMEVELVHEKEVEREVERLPSAQPDKHVLRRDVVEFVQSGQFPPNSSAFRNARVALTCTSLNLPSGFDEVFRNLYFTEDFCRTVTLPLLKSTAMDNFLRPVEWLVTPSVLPSSGPLPLVALSPFEANELLPLFRRTTITRLHIFHARSNLSSRSLESLCSFSLPNSSTPIPRSISLQLNLFSGALYIQDEQSYRDICKTLRLHLDELPDHLAKPEIITSTCFVKDSKARIELGMTGPGFDGSPLPFLRQFITLRRYGKGFGPAHMGKILHGIKLEPPDFGRSDPE